MQINELLVKENILMNISCESKEDVIKQLVDKIQDNLYSVEGCYKDVLLRESQVSTGLVCGIAIPHTQSENVKTSTISIAKITSDIEWTTIDDSKVKTVIMITVPINSNGEHLKILAAIAEKLMDKELCDALNDATTEERIIEILEGRE